MLPTALEKGLWERGLLIAGIDEVGRGCLAGPVVAAAVILVPNATLDLVDDSKRLSPKQRERCFTLIQKKAKAIGIGLSSAEEIDEMNILKASLLAMKRAVKGLKIRPDYLLIDGPYGIDIEISQVPIKHGDKKVLSIAAASVVAKVVRDQLMHSYSLLFPSYGFSKNKGYPTQGHRKAILRFGPCYLHRLSFKLKKY